jgi:hypothetical protein
MLMTQENANILMAFQFERENLLRQFNPHNEPVAVIEVIERKELELIRPLTGWRVIDKEATAEQGHQVVKEPPPVRKTHKIREKDLEVAGRRDCFNYVDADDLDERTGLPVLRLWHKGEQLKAPLTNAVYMEAVGQVKRVPYAKDKDGNTIADDTGILLPEYADKYKVENVSVWGIFDQLQELRKQFEEYKEKHR